MHTVTHSFVVTMESLKQLSWVIVKKEVVVEQRRSWKEIREEIRTGRRKRPERETRLEELAKEIGWMDVVTTQWRIERKRSAWKDVHRDIVSTIM